MERGFPPAVRDICEAVHLKSTSSVHSHLETLEKNGYIRRDPTKPRAIEILDDSFNFTRREMVNVPIVGRVAAGEPLLAEQNIEEYFPIPMDFMPNKQTFMLKVKGESMINAGILDGDYVLVEERKTAHNGEMIVALVDDGATVKRFYKEEGIIRLQPENEYNGADHCAGLHYFRQSNWCIQIYEVKKAYSKNINHNKQNAGKEFYFHACIN